MASMHRWAMKVADEMQRQGWRARYGAGHIILYPPDGLRPLTLSVSPGDAHVPKLILKDIKKRGGDISNLSY